MSAIDLEKINPEIPEGAEALATQELDELYVLSKLRYVAFLDVLGFKNLVDRKSAAEVHHRYLNVLQTTPEDLYPEECKVRAYVFSDSIILYSLDDSLESAVQILSYATFLLVNATACGTLIKGSVAHGEFTADAVNNIYFGVPLIDAYQLEEEMKVASVILHHSLEAKISEYSSKDLDDLTVLAETPMKGYKVKHKHLRWFSLFHTKSFLDLFYPQASGSARVYVENTAALIDGYLKEEAGQQ